jgi:hypothetical protein
VDPPDRLPRAILYSVTLKEVSQRAMTNSLVSESALRRPDPFCFTTFPSESCKRNRLDYIPFIKRCTKFIIGRKRALTLGTSRSNGLLFSTSWLCPQIEIRGC